jgi:predicted transcriptional regulator|tara:strand:- start:3401 stop:3685 length:285 start_codon:yes stop_codon:yes gene_type:complete
MKKPEQSVKQKIIDYVKKKPENAIYHPADVSKDLDVNAEHTRNVMKELADDGFLILLQDKNKYFFTLKKKQGIDPSIVSRPPLNKRRDHGKVNT